jgi:hypothetical protein
MTHRKKCKNTTLGLTLANTWHLALFYFCYAEYYYAGRCIFIAILSDIMWNVESHYAECHFAECRGTIHDKGAKTPSITHILHSDNQSNDTQNNNVKT